MKFKDVKIGDTVIYEKSVRFGFNSGKDFNVPAKVIRVTPTQFVLENGSKFRKDGRGIGEDKYTTCFVIGEEISNYCGIRVIEDETDKMNEFIRLLRTEKEIMNDIQMFNLKRNSGLSQNNLDSILAKVNEIKELLKLS